MFQRCGWIHALSDVASNVCHILTTVWHTVACSEKQYNRDNCGPSVLAAGNPVAVVAITCVWHIVWVRPIMASLMAFVTAFVTIGLQRRQRLATQYTCPTIITCHISPNISFIAHTATV